MALLMPSWLNHLEWAEWPHKRFAAEFKAFFGRMAHAMRIWVDACRQLDCPGFRRESTTSVQASLVLTGSQSNVGASAG